MVFPGRFDDRVVVVTGSAQGIGAAVAQRVAAEGGAVVLGDRSPLVEEVAASIRAEGATAVAHECDLERYDGAEALVSRALAEHGRVDVWINNVGGTIWTRPFEHYDVAAIEQEITRSLFPTLWCCRAVLPHMVDRGRGTIVNVSSIATRSVNRVPYAAAKGGVNALTASLAFEAASKGVRVVATAPGRHRGAGQAGAPQRRRAGCRGRSLVRRDRRPDGRQHAPGSLRHPRRAGRTDPLPRLRRGLLRHRQRPAGRRW